MANYAAYAPISNCANERCRAARDKLTVTKAGRKMVIHCRRCSHRWSVEPTGSVRERLLRKGR